MVEGQDVDVVEGDAVDGPFLVGADEKVIDAAAQAALQVGRRQPGGEEDVRADRIARAGTGAARPGSRPPPVADGGGGVGRAGTRAEVVVAGKAVADDADAVGRRQTAEGRARLVVDADAVDEAGDLVERRLHRVVRVDWPIRG